MRNDLAPDLLLEARDLVFGYPGRTIGRGASLAVRKGDICCLLGPNGCGKTTLFKTLLGLLPAKGGEIRIGAVEIRHMSRQDMARAIAYVPQNIAAPFAFTAFEMVLMGRNAHQSAFARPSRHDTSVARQSLEALGISHLADQDVTQLSGGQRQLVGIARALAQESSLVIMDEPTASLDFGNQIHVLEKIRGLADQGRGILLSTHNPDHAFALATHVTLMKEGQIKIQGTPAEAMTAQHLGAIYDVKLRVEKLSGGGRACVPDLNP